MTEFKINSSHRTVLVVEDDREIRESLQELLEVEGYAVATATNGLEAIELLRSTTIHPKLVLLDMMMPVMDGMGFLDILTKDAILGSIPVYIHSANHDINNLNGARGLITKPAHYEEILKLVESYCK